MLLLASVAMTGCASPDPVTYVDPNDDASYIGIGGAGGSEPFVTYGADVASRAKAIVRIRGMLAVARTVQPASPDEAAALVDRTMVDDLVTIEPRLALGKPALRTALRSSLEALRDTPPTDAAAYNAAVLRVSGALLDQAETVVIPVAARQDPGFRAAVLTDTISDASLRYEEAMEATDDESDRLLVYRIAYGMLLDARTRGLSAIPERDRRTIQEQLKKIADRALPTPTPPAAPVRAEQVVADLGSAADLVASSAEIDTILPTPDATTPDRLRAIKRGVAAALETHEQGNIPASLTQLRQIATTSLESAAPGLAAVDPALLTTIERALLIDLPAAFATTDTATTVATELDAQLDEAIAVVASELEALREP